MKVIDGWQRRISRSGRLVGLLVFALFFASAGRVDGAAPGVEGWQLERGAEKPGYAFIEPARSNLNIDVLVLTCAVARTTTILQLELYLSTDGPLRPEGVEPRLLRDDPRAVIVIDGRSFPVTMFFADDHVLVADAATDRMPSVSTSLADAIQDGKVMVMRFDLVAGAAGRAAGFDSEATFDLQANGGGAAVASVRWCALPRADRLSSTEPLRER